MKRKYAVFLILLGLPLLDIFYACCNCEEGTEEKFYINSGFSLVNLDNSGENPLEITDVSINKNAYGMRLKVEREVITFKNKQENLFSFTPTAYAFSCDCPPTVTYEPQYKAQAIKIVTLNDFNAEKPANSDVTEYFKTSKSYLSVNETVKRLNNYFGYTPSKTETIDYLLMVPPTNVNTEHQFKVIILFENKPNVELLTTVNLK
ncbi:DUF5034 domain-containing protein [Flavobacterium sp. xlx-214]|uniref:DUF5034 domain-containing protein n=1 Tax=unclassified Flavobacterium TaxID=196869 RepID=UPI0013D7B433|nr:MULTISPECIES: DUF5034 domain-containing protein [unclassified Flavobacterium]MBA5791650.1 DUF5034 domain-containing protein [Flavobacterium sp. xlx-221]QMI82893.1 DUF5034 domain-containing protein [Flavobacterium sp. xlx-214]